MVDFTPLSPTHLRNQAEREAYEYYKNNIDPNLDLSDPRNRHNNAVDAFRHAYTSGRFAQNYTSVGSWLAGYANELASDLSKNQDPDSRNMDMINNMFGIVDGERTNSKKELLDKLKQRLENGDLIIDPKNPNNIRYEGPDPTKWFNTQIREPIKDIIDKTIDATDAAVDGMREAFGNIPDDLRDVFDNFFNQPNNEDGTKLDPWPNLKNAWDLIKDIISPLVLDLNGNGIKSISVENSTAYFDLDNDKFAQKSGWVGADNGFLALDINSNGKIDNISELFGDGETDGFTALSKLDTNNDNIINKLDSIFSDLIIWQDANQDGISQSLELTNLSHKNIASISLESANVPVNQQNVHGNVVTHTSAYTLTNGTKQEIVDIWFQHDPFYSRYTGDYTPDIDVIGFPMVSGRGQLQHLAIAMSQDITLKALVYDLATASPEDGKLFNAKLEDVLFRWAGVDTIAPDSRGEHVNAQQLAFLEKAMGSPFVRTYDGGANPRPGAGRSIEQLYISVKHQLGFVLALQGPLRQYLSAPGYDPIYDRYTLSNDQAGQMLAALAADVADSEHGKEFLTDVITMMRAVQSNVDLFDFESSIQNAFISSGLSPETVPFFPGLNFVLGTDSNDSLYGRDGADLIDGGLGNDYLRGGEGDDSYIFQIGYGHDTIDEGGPSTDAIYFGADILPNQVAVSRISNWDLKFTFGGSTDTLTIDNQYYPLPIRDRIESFVFTDGTTWSYRDVELMHLQGTDGNDTIRHSYFDDTLYAGLGNDKFYDDGDGNDTYIYSLGDGQDEIHEQGGIDQIIFTSDIHPENVRFEIHRNLDDLTFTFVSSPTDELEISRQYFRSKDYVETFEFANGIVWTGQQIWNWAQQGLNQAPSQYNEIIGTNSDENLSGTSGADRITGNDGDDYLTGKAGNDQYVYNLGNGQDFINDNSIDDGDSLKFGSGITPDALILSPRAGQPDDAYIEFAGDGTGGRITLDGQFSLDGHGRIETFLFANGDQWDWKQFYSAFHGRPYFEVANYTPLPGTPAKDNQNGTTADEVFSVSAGNDLLRDFTSSNDLYRFEAGMGKDTVIDQGSALDILLFGAGVAPGDVVLSPRAGKPLDVYVEVAGNTADRLTIEGQFTADQRIEEFRFADAPGTLWGWQEVEVRFFDADAAYVTLTDPFNDDSIQGSSADEQLIGGLGNDFLSGKDGNDLYFYEAGDGRDYIKDNSDSAYDVIQFASGIRAADMDIAPRNGQPGDVYLTFNNDPSAQLTIDGQFDNTGRIEEIRFADQTVWTWQYLEKWFDGDIARLNPMTDLANDDNVQGTDQDDWLQGGDNPAKTTEFLAGGAGNDAYFFGVGDGKDLIADSSGDSDALFFGVGIMPDDINLSPRAGQPGDVYLNVEGYPDNRITIDGQFDNTGRIESFHFADGTHWTWQQIEQMATGIAGFDTAIFTSQVS